MTMRPILEPVRRILERPPRLYLGGEWVDSAGGEVIEVLDPSNGARIASSVDASSADVDAAARAARRAFEEGPWVRMFSPSDRQRCLWRLAELIERNAEVLAQIDSLDNGKPYLRVLAGDVPAAAAHFAYYAGWCTKLTGKTLPVDAPNMHTFTVREPVGVVGLITPWNYPLLMAAWKLAPALAAGNCVILKPAEQTPLSATLLADLTAEAGFPPGVFNVLTGVGKSAGADLVAHRGVDKIGFTGSLEVARDIVRNSAADLKRVSLELGGKSPNVVFDDADLEVAVEGSAWAVFGNSGQSCTAGSRLYVHEPIFDELIDRLGAIAGRISVGPGMSEADHDLGPVVSDEQLHRILGWVGRATEDGATVACGGARAGGALSDGYFVEPTVLVDVDDRMAVAREEIFGPVVVAMPFATVDEVIERANDTPFGLAAGVWTRDLGRAHIFASNVRAGTIWVNSWGLTEAGVPFGGMKQSGHGREMGEEAFELYTETKSVWMGWS